MSLNLSKYGAEMQKAWKAVCDSKDETNWALYGYEGSTFDLKLVATGEDGMEELMEEFNASRIMYAFLKVDDPNTSLPKFVLINWQGESAPATRKGKAATHLRDVEKYFHGHHITVDARNEDDVVEEEIIAKVSKASAGKFNFGERHFMQEDSAPAPVGTCHQRIIPQKELPSLDEREKFWNSEETKERERKEQDKTRRVSEAKRLDLERREREKQEALAREEKIKEREKKISVIRNAEAASSVGTAADERSKWERQKNQDGEEGDEARRRRGEEMKRMRSEEVRQLISQRSGNAKAVFERHSSVGQMNFRRRSNAAGISEHEEKKQVDIGSRDASAYSQDQRGSNGASYSAEAKQAEVEDIVVVPPPDSFGNDDSESDRVPMGNGSAVQGVEAGLGQANVHCPPPDITTNTESKPDILKDVAGTKSGPDITQGSSSSSGMGQNRSLDQNGGEQAQGSDGKPKLHPKYGICALALYDYQAADETEISFDPGQVVTHIDQIDSGWWQGVGPDGGYGLFPANYVEIIDPNELVAD